MDDSMKRLDVALDLMQSIRDKPGFKELFKSQYDNWPLIKKYQLVEDLLANKPARNYCPVCSLYSYGVNMGPCGCPFSSGRRPDAILVLERQAKIDLAATGSLELVKIVSKTVVKMVHVLNRVDITTLKPCDEDPLVTKVIEQLENFHRSLSEEVYDKAEVTQAKEIMDTVIACDVTFVAKGDDSLVAKATVIYDEPDLKLKVTKLDNPIGIINGGLQCTIFADKIENTQMTPGLRERPHLQEVVLASDKSSDGSLFSPFTFMDWLSRHSEIAKSTKRVDEMDLPCFTYGNKECVICETDFDATYTSARSIYEEFCLKADIPFSIVGFSPDKLRIAVRLYAMKAMIESVDGSLDIFVASCVDWMPVKTYESIKSVLDNWKYFRLRDEILEILVSSTSLELFYYYLYYLPPDYGGDSFRDIINKIQLESTFVRYVEAYMLGFRIEKGKSCYCLGFLGSDHEWNSIRISEKVPHCDITRYFIRWRNSKPHNAFNMLYEIVTHSSTTGVLRINPTSQVLGTLQETKSAFVKDYYSMKIRLHNEKPRNDLCFMFRVLPTFRILESDLSNFLPL